MFLEKTFLACDSLKNASKKTFLLKIFWIKTCKKKKTMLVLLLFKWYDDWCSSKYFFFWYPKENGKKEKENSKKEEESECESEWLGQQKEQQSRGFSRLDKNFYTPTVNWIQVRYRGTATYPFQGLLVFQMRKLIPYKLTH